MFRLLPRTRSSAIADRLHVNEYFAKSLKVIRNHTVEKGVCITAYCNSVYTSYEAPLGNDCKQLQVLMRTGRTKNGPIPGLKPAGLDLEAVLLSRAAASVNYYMRILFWISLCGCR